MASSFQCDVCRAAFHELGDDLETVLIRAATNTKPALAHATIDVCKKPECRKVGFSQLTTRVMELCLENDAKDDPGA